MRTAAKLRKPNPISEICTVCGSQPEKESEALSEILDEIRLHRTITIDFGDCPLTNQYRHEYLGSEEASRARKKQLLREYKATHGKLPVVY